MNNSSKNINRTMESNYSRSAPCNMGTAPEHNDHDRNDTRQLPSNVALPYNHENDHEGNGDTDSQVKIIYTRTEKITSPALTRIRKIVNHIVVLIEVDPTDTNVEGKCKRKKRHHLYMLSIVLVFDSNKYYNCTVILFK